MYLKELQREVEINKALAFACSHPRWLQPGQSHEVGTTSSVGISLMGAGAILCYFSQTISRTWASDFLGEWQLE